jgi:hypothetical protein
VIDSRFVQAVCSALRADPTITPIPDDFDTSDGFYIWEQSIRMNIQEALAHILTKKYISLSRGNSSRVASRNFPIRLKAKIVEARELTTKDRNLRDPFCHIQVENVKDKDASEIYSTEIIKGSNTPYWNQHVFLNIKHLDDKVNFEIWDDKKKHFLGRVLLNAAKLLDELDENGSISGWYLLDKHPKQKSKYVGGELYLDISNENPVFFYITI